MVAKTPKRTKTESIARLSRDELDIGKLLYPESNYWRPKTRADCKNVPRPCPYVSCQYNLYIDVTEFGSIRYNFPDTPVHDLPHTNCTLDYADNGPSTLPDVAVRLNVTRQMCHRIEQHAKLRLRVITA